MAKNGETKVLAGTLVSPSIMLAVTTAPRPPIPASPIRTPQRQWLDLAYATISPAQKSWTSTRPSRRLSDNGVA
jgi:hypothetical protein